jgi:hypothetical protein
MGEWMLTPEFMPEFMPESMPDLFSAKCRGAVENINFASIDLNQILA